MVRKWEVTDEQVRQAMVHCKGVISQAAEYLGIPRKTFSRYVANLPQQDLVPESTLSLKPKVKGRYVVTWAQNDTEIHKPFFEALKRYCEHKNAQLLVIRGRYKNVNAFINNKDHTVAWPTELAPYYLDYDLEVNKNLIILGDLKVPPTATSPLSGIENIGGNKSAIVGHPQIQMRMVPTPIYELPKQLLTTGSISLKNYSISKGGKRSAFHHCTGATVVEVDGNTFWTRQINATDEGSFYELDYFYSSDKDPEPAIVEALVCGDTHEQWLDEGVEKATWGAGSITEVCKPKHQFLQDLLDFYSQNHHHEGDPYVQFAKFHSGMSNVFKELGRVASFLDKLLKITDSIFHITPANHHDHLTKWLKKNTPHNDPENAWVYHHLNERMFNHILHHGEIPDPLELYVKPRVTHPDRVFFHKRGEKVLVLDIDVNQHGDVGNNGSRGTIKSFAKSGYKTIIGHSHTPGIELGCYQVGTSSKLVLEYNKSGYSSWAHTHCLVYPNGKRTLVTIVDGRWRLE